MNANLGPLPIGPHDHPDPHVMVWSELELRAIRAYAERCMAAERERCAKAVHAAIHSVHPAMRQSADIMMNAVNKAIGYPIKP